MEMQSVIKDECGTVVRFCNDYSEAQNEEFLQEHPEYTYSCLEVDRE